MQFLFLSVLLNTGLISMAFKLVNKVKSADHPRGFGTAKHVVIIGIDGFGGAYVRNFTSQLPTIQTFFDGGAYTTEGRNILPADSAPNWAGYLTGMSVSQTGVYSKLWVTDDSKPLDMITRLPPSSGRGRRPETIFRIVKEQNSSAKTQLLFTMSWFIEIAKKNEDIDDWFWGHEGIACGDAETKVDCLNRQDWNVQRKTIEGIKKVRPTLTFIQLEAVDAAGHDSYWASKLYYEMMKDADRKIAGIMEALAKTEICCGKSMLNETMVVVIGDHGGYGDDHGVRPPSIADIYVPMLFRGPGIRNINLDSSELAERDISTLDMPVTVLNALGLKPGKYMRGRVMEEIYEP